MTIQHIIDISLHSSAWAQHIPKIEQKVEDIASTALAAMDYKSGQELSIVLCDDAFIKTLNHEYRGKDKATNVLSFPQNEDGLLGDIVLAYETVNKESTAQNKSFEDHMTHLIIHGLLHLMGHDHEEDHEANAMEALEIEILEKMGVKNPYTNRDLMA